MKYRCPECNSTELAVEVKIMVKLYQSEDNFETEDVGSDHECDATSLMQCDECSYVGEAHEFDTFEDVSKPVPPKTSSPIHDPWGLSKLD